MPGRGPIQLQVGGKERWLEGLHTVTAGAVGLGLTSVQTHGSNTAYVNSHCLPRLVGIVLVVCRRVGHAAENVGKKSF